MSPVKGLDFYMGLRFPKNYCVCILYIYEKWQAVVAILLKMAAFMSVFRRLFFGTLKLIGDILLLPEITCNILTGQATMGHRHIFNPSQIFEADNEQGWSYAEQPYIPIGIVSHHFDFVSYILLIGWNWIFF